MTLLDARIPLVFGAAAAAGRADAVLCEGEGEGDPARGRDWFLPKAATGHPTNCACCTPRNEAGHALARLLLARGRGTGLFFNRVVVVTVTEAGVATVRRALAADPVASAYFREVPGR